MEKKRLAINLFTNFISYSTIILIAFFITPYLIRTVGKDAYSFYPLINNLVSYMSVITVALNSMAIRFITIELVRNNLRKANSYFVSVLYSNVTLASLLLVIMFFIIIFLEKLLNIPDNLIPSVKILFTLVFLSMLINIIGSVFEIAVFAKNRMDLRSLIEIIQGIQRVTLYIILFTFFRSSIIYIGVVTISLSTVYFISHFIFTKWLLPELSLSFKYFDRKAINEILPSGIWNSVNQLGVLLLSSLSLLICNILFSPEIAGEYAIVLLIPTCISGIISMLSSVFMPIITQKYAEGNTNLVVQVVQNSQRIMGLVTNIFVVVFMVVGEEFFLLWVPGEDAHKLHMLSLMAIGHLVITGVTWPIFNLNTVLNKVKIPSLYIVGSGVVNLGIMLFFINYLKLGIYSIPLSTLIVNLIWVGVFVPIYPCKYLVEKKTIFYPPIIKSLIGASIIYFIASITKKTLPISNWLDLLFVCVISGVIGLFVNLIIIFKPAEIKDTSKKIILLFMNRAKSIRNRI